MGMMDPWNLRTNAQPEKDGQYAYYYCLPEKDNNNNKRIPQVMDELRPNPYKYVEW